MFFFSCGGGLDDMSAPMAIKHMTSNERGYPCVAPDREDLNRESPARAEMFVYRLTAADVGTIPAA